MPVLHHVSKLQTSVQEVTVTPRPYEQPNKGRLFRTGGHFVSSLRADRATYQHALTLTNFSFLTFSVAFFFISSSLTHVSADPQVVTSHLQQLGTKRWRVSQGAEWQFYSC